MTNTLAYYDAESITTAKILTVQSPEEWPTFKKLRIPFDRQTIFSKFESFWELSVSLHISALLVIY